jgi:hypothetical protein
MEKEILTIDTPTETLEDKLLSAEDVDEIKDIINMFNLNIKKKNIIRTNKLNELQDKISDQMTQRIDKKAGEFSNKDLLDYFKVLQDTINKSDNNLDGVDIPSIQINQNQVNINVKDELDKDSRDRVADAVNSILAKIKQSQPDEGNIIDVEYQEEEEEENPND